MKPCFRNSLYVFSFLPAFAVIYGNLHGGIFSLCNVVFSLGFLAVIEWLVPPLTSNNHSSKQDGIPHTIAILHLPIQMVCITSLFAGIYLNHLQGLWILGAALSTGLNSGSSAIVLAHEMIHRKNKFEQWMGRALLFSAGNLYFFVTHLRVHHKWVGTSKDHSSANRGESLYAFFMRSVSQQFKGALQLERDRLKKEGISNPLKNYVVRQLILQSFLIFALFLIGGFWFVSAWLIQCVFANFLLEYINYVQHYGLTRLENERVTEHHSWDCNQLVSRFVLVDLARHADHHYYASKPYHTLETFDFGPKLPSGYAGLFVIAAIPSFWRKLMDHRIPS